MKIPISWLKEYVSIDLSPAEIAARLTMAGTESEVIEGIGRNWGSSVVVGFVNSIRPHPEADRLNLVTVATGNDQNLSVEVVCGAPNIVPGQKVPYASVGAALIDPQTGKIKKLKRAKIRGVISEGMICSESELGLGDNHDGILALDDSAPVGMPLGEYLNETTLDLELTPNRPDCLGVVGVAREVAVLTKCSLVEPTTDYIGDGPDVDSMASIEVQATDLCPRYTAVVFKDVVPASSPKWLVDRLAMLGQSSVNNIVDITNYVMFELGQPLHAFDLDQVADHRVMVRRALSGERLVTLDGENRELTSSMLVIADSERPIGLAGVMGGANTQIHKNTKNVLLESATFDGSNIRSTASALGIRTEATIRFEKGLLPGLAEVALKRATRMILEISGGKAGKGILDVRTNCRQQPSTIRVSQEQISRILGIEFTAKQIKSTLRSLGFGIEICNDYFEIQTPYWRPDVTIPEDIAEELARVIGYDVIPTTVISTPIPKWVPNPMRDLRETVRDSLVASGMQETISYPLTTVEAQELVSPPSELPAPIPVLNPLSAERSVMRTTLRSSVLETLLRNVRTWRGPISIFEIGRVYLEQGIDLPLEREMVVGALSGPRTEDTWLEETGNLDFFDAKGIVKGVLDTINLKGLYADFNDKTFASGRCASIAIDGIYVGVLGELSQAVLKMSDANLSRITMFEINIDKLFESMGHDSTKLTNYKPVWRYPESTHDLAIVVDDSIPGAAAVALAERNKLVVRVDIFDVYRNREIPKGSKSLALRIVYQSPNRTLAADEINKAEKAILKSLKRELGAVLRT